MLVYLKLTYLYRKIFIMIKSKISSFPVHTNLVSINTIEKKLINNEILFSVFM